MQKCSFYSKNAFFSILAIMSAFYGANFQYYDLIFLFMNFCVHINKIFYGKDDKVIFGYDIQPQKLNKWLISSILVFFTNFGHFGRGPSRSNFCDRFKTHPNAHGRSLAITIQLYKI